MHSLNGLFLYHTLFCTNNQLYLSRIRPFKPILPCLLQRCFVITEENIAPTHVVLLAKPLLAGIANFGALRDWYPALTV